MGASSNGSVEGTQQQRRHQLVHREAPNVATENMTLDAHLKIICTTASRTNITQHAIGCEYVHIMVYGHQFIEWWTAGILRELRDQYLTAHNGKPPWSMMAVVRTVREIERHDAVSSGIVVDQVGEKRPRELTNKGLNTLEEATEAYMVEVIADSHFQKQQLISCRFSTCLLLWQGNEVGYS